MSSATSSAKWSRRNSGSWLRSLSELVIRIWHAYAAIALHSENWVSTIWRTERRVTSRRSSNVLQVNKEQPVEGASDPPMDPKPNNVVALPTSSCALCLQRFRLREITVKDGSREFHAATCWTIVAEAKARHHSQLMRSDGTVFDVTVPRVVR